MIQSKILYELLICLAGCFWAKQREQSVRRKNYNNRITASSHELSTKAIGEVPKDGSFRKIWMRVVSLCRFVLATNFDGRTSRAKGRNRTRLATFPPASALVTMPVQHATNSPYSGLLSYELSFVRTVSIPFSSFIDRSIGVTMSVYIIFAVHCTTCHVRSVICHEILFFFIIINWNVLYFHI